MPPPDAPVPSQDPGLAPKFTFDAFFVERVHFEHLERQSTEDSESRPERVPLDLRIGGSLLVDHENRRAQVTLDVVLLPDPKWQPYKIEVRVLGRFSQLSGTPEQFEQFCKVGAPPILFPYAREIAYSVTRDGGHGVVRVHPINVQSIIGEWEQEQHGEQSEKEQPGATQ